MSLIVRFLCITAMLLIVGCNHSGATNPTESTTTGSGTGGTVTTPGTGAVFTLGNSEGLAIQVTSRMNMVLAEVFRNLQRLNRDVAIMNTPFAAATSGATIASFAPGYCPGNGSGSTGAEVVEFQDIDLLSTFSTGDIIIFSYGNTNCILSSVTDLASEPNEVGGYARYTFNVASSMPDVGAGDRTFSGSVEFLNYGYVNGVLAHIETDQDTILSGTIDFTVTFDNSVDNSGNGASTAAFSSTSTVSFSGNTSGPISLQFPAIPGTPSTPAIERDVNSSGDTDLTIRGLVAIFESDQTTTTVNTIDDATGTAAPLAALSTGFPTSGALQFNGGENTSVRVLSQPASIGLGVLRLDANGNGIYGDNINESPEPTDWNHTVMGFLIPGSLAQPTLQPNHNL